MADNKSRRIKIEAINPEQVIKFDFNSKGKIKSKIDEDEGFISIKRAREEGKESVNLFTGVHFHGNKVVKRSIKSVKKVKVHKDKLNGKVNIKDIYIKTNVDLLLDEIKTGDKTVNDLAVKFNVSPSKVEEWGLDLQEQKLVEVIYPANPLLGVKIKLVKDIVKQKFVFSNGKEIQSYNLFSDNIPITIRILDINKNVFVYEVIVPIIRQGTEAIINLLTTKISEEVDVTSEELINPRMMEIIKKRFYDKAIEKLKDKFPQLDEVTKKILAGFIIHKMYGLKDVELLMSDDNLEEISINGSEQPIAVYHKKIGWCITNLKPNNEEEVLNFASSIGRKVGKSISFMNPLMDARLISGDRVQATLFPISNSGNTITIRKFSKNPWTVTQYIKNRTINSEIAAFIWLAIHYELSIMIAGGTASGKTSCLNAFTALIPPNQRIISIEDIREISLPKPVHWNWVPLTVREGRSEGAGNISMLDLMITSLRMRPDRIIVGEVRKKKQAEVLFEAIHTGHSVYTTIHADNAEQAFVRVVEEPLSIPKIELEGLHLIVIMFRDRRRGFRKLIQVAELVPIPGDIGERDIKINLLYRWAPKNDSWDKLQNSERVINEIALHTGMSEDDIKIDLKEKKDVLDWMVKHDVMDINSFGKIIEVYYRDPKRVISFARDNRQPGELF